MSDQPKKEEPKSTINNLLNKLEELSSFDHKTKLLKGGAGGVSVVGLKSLTGPLSPQKPVVVKKNLETKTSPMAEIHKLDSKATDEEG